MKLLHIDSSIAGEASASRQLSAAIVAAFKASVPGLEVIRRDLDADPIPHLDGRLLPTVRPASAPARAAGVPDEIGIGDVEIVRAEELALGPEQRQTAMRAALASIPAIVSKAAPRRAA